jgi:acetoin utilization protein AcuB
MPEILVKEVMSSPVCSVAPNTRLPVIKHLLHEHSIRHLPVVDRGELIGMISLGDVRNAFPSDAALLSIHDISNQLDKITAADILRLGVVTVAADAPLADAVALLLQHRIGCLPVLEARRMIGIVTASDILRASFPREANQSVMAGIADDLV